MVLTEFEKKNASGKDLSKRLSKSKLNTFITCPKQYWFSQYFPQKAEIVPAMVRGSELHDLFEEVYKVPHLDKSKLLATFNTLKNGPKYEKEVTKFIKWLDELGIVKPESVEEKIYNKEDDVVIKYDRIDFDGDTRILWDYKSGRVHPVKDFKFELGLYALFYQKEHKKPIHFVGIYFIDSGTYDLIKVDKQLLQEVYTTFLENKELIKDYQNLNVWPAKKNWKCKWCRWKDDCEVYNKKW